jgi:hypothetical protein
VVDDDGDGRRWQEPHAGTTSVLLRSGGLGLCFLLAVTAAFAGNWDVAAVAAVLAVPLAFDLWGDLRPRRLVLAGPDLLVISTGRRTTAVPWDDISQVSVRQRRLRRSRPVVVRTDGTTVDLPAGVPLATVQRWLTDR